MVHMSLSHEKHPYVEKSSAAGVSQVVRAPA